MTRKGWLTTAIAALNAMTLSLVVQAQQSAPDVDINVGTQSSPAWYGQWYVWAILVGVFLVIIVAITNRGSRQT